LRINLKPQVFLNSLRWPGTGRMMLSPAQATTAGGRGFVPSFARSHRTSAEFGIRSNPEIAIIAAGRIPGNILGRPLRISSPGRSWGFMASPRFPE
jgi:hypothetical protein